MSRLSSDFSPEPDEALGSALRAALDRPDDAAFASAVVARAAAAGVGSSRAVLGRWTPAAVAAAVVAALVSGWLVGNGTTQATPAYDAVWITSETGSSAAAELFTAPQPPDMEMVFASLAVD